jgi:membrane associated rhomboid family serine protease
VAGASGAVAGLLGGYLALFPYSRVLVLVYLIAYIDVVEVPATFFLGAWFIVQAAGAMTPAPFDALPDGAAFAANLGAFVFGMGVIRAVRPRMRWDYRKPLRRKSRDTRDNSITSVSNS